MQQHRPAHTTVSGPQGNTNKGVLLLLAQGPWPHHRCVSTHTHTHTHASARAEATLTRPFTQLQACMCQAQSARLYPPTPRNGLGAFCSRSQSVRHTMIRSCCPMATTKQKAEAEPAAQRAGLRPHHPRQRHWHVAHPHLFDRFQGWWHGTRQGSVTSSHVEETA